MTDTAVVVQPRADIARQEFGAKQTQIVRETAATAVAARAQAEVQARYIIALQRPRNLHEVRVRLLEHCKRPGFAKKARYAKPIGQDKIEGPSIRFVETALLEYGNNQPESVLVYEDPEKMICKVQVTDFERNVTHAVDIVVRKTVERKKLAQGQKAISQRRNSYGETTYLVPATDDQIANNKASAESKAIRNMGLRILPADIVEEAMDQVVATQRSQVEDDPDAERKKLVDHFYKLGVSPKDINVYLGHDLAKTTPAELVDLRVVWMTLHDGEAVWADALAQKLGERGSDPEQQDTPSQGASALKQRLAAKRGKKPSEPPKDDSKAAASKQLVIDAETLPKSEAKLEPKVEPEVEPPVTKCKGCGVPTSGSAACEACAREEEPEWTKKAHTKNGDNQ